METDTVTIKALVIKDHMIEKVELFVKPQVDEDEDDENEKDKEKKAEPEKVGE